MIKKGPKQREWYNYSPFALCLPSPSKKRVREGGGLRLNAQNSAGPAEEETAGDGSRAGAGDRVDCGGGRALEGQRLRDALEVEEVEPSRGRQPQQMKVETKVLEF